MTLLRLAGHSGGESTIQRRPASKRACAVSCQRLVKWTASLRVARWRVCTVHTIMVLQITGVHEDGAAKPREPKGLPQDVRGD